MLKQRKMAHWRLTWIILGVAILLGGWTGNRAGVAQAGMPSSGQVISVTAPFTPTLTGDTVKTRRNTFETFPANVALFRWINTHRTYALDVFFSLLLYTGKGWVLIPILLLLWLFRRQQIAPLLLAIAIETALVTVLKDLADQLRPPSLLPGVYLLEKLHHGSFPSGDVAMAFVIACTLTWGEHRWLQIALYAYAVLIMYERIYVGAHFPLDVLAGAVIGAGSALAARYFVQHFRARPPVTREAPPLLTP